MLASILLSILTVAASIGLSEGIDAINRERIRKGELSPDKMISLINSKLSQIQKKSSSAYSKIMDKINAMPVIAEAGNLKAYLSRVRDKNQQLKEAASNTLTNVENTVVDLKNRAANLANQSDSYKLSKSGKDEYKGLINDAGKASEYFSKEVEKVEKAI